MKKILIFAAVIVAGVAAHAASVKWSAGNIYDHTGTSKYQGEVTLYAVAAGGAFADAFIVASASSSATGAITATTASSDSLVAGSYYDFYLFIEDGGATFTSSPKENIVMQPTGTATVSFGNMTTQTQDASNWAAAPEPTSGLLMLLGVAELALRRRRV